MSNPENLDVKSEDFVIRINKKRVKQIALAVATVTGVAGVVYLARNLSFEATEDSVTVELETA